MVALLARLFVSLGVVIGLMVLAGRVMQGRARVGGRKTGANIEVLGRHTVGRNASVTIVKAAGKALVLGVTEKSVTVLAELDPAELTVEDEPAPTTTPAGLNWQSFLQSLRERTVRR